MQKITIGKRKEGKKVNRGCPPKTDSLVFFYSLDVLWHGRWVTRGYKREPMWGS